MSDLQYRAAIFGYRIKDRLRKRFRHTQEERQKPKNKQKLKWIDSVLYWTVERWWFKKLPQKPEIELNFCGHNGRRHIIECYPGKSKGVDDRKVKALEAAWKIYKREPQRKKLMEDYIDCVIRDCAELGHLHDLSDTDNPIIAGLFRGYKISYCQGKSTAAANLERSDPWANIWVYQLHGATIPNLKLWEDNRRYIERRMGTAVLIDNPPDCPDAVRIRPRRRVKSRPLPKTGGTSATSLRFGVEAETRKIIEIPIANMRHTFGIGTPGAGKTAMMEGLMLTALGAREFVENVYYVDVAKEAAGLDHVEKAGAIFARNFTEFYDMINTIYDVMKLRTKVMKRTKTAERRIFLFLDEAAQVFDPDLETEGIDKAQQIQSMKRIIRFSQLARAANITLMTFTQKPTIDFIPSSFLDNHEGRICLRVLRPRTANDFMNVDFEWDPTRFADGEFAMLWPGWMKERYGRGFISDKMR